MKAAPGVKAVVVSLTTAGPAPPADVAVTTVVSLLPLPFPGTVTVTVTTVEAAGPSSNGPGVSRLPQFRELAQARLKVSV